MKRTLHYLFSQSHMSATITPKLIDRHWPIADEDHFVSQN